MSDSDIDFSGSGSESLLSGEDNGGGLPIHMSGPVKKYTCISSKEVSASCATLSFSTTGCMSLAKEDPEDLYQGLLDDYCMSLAMLILQQSDEGLSRTFPWPSETALRDRMICCIDFGKCHCLTTTGTIYARWGRSMTHLAVKCCSNFRDFSMRRLWRADFLDSKHKLSWISFARRRSICFTFLGSTCWSRAFLLNPGKSSLHGLLKFEGRGALGDDSLEEWHCSHGLHMLLVSETCPGKTGRLWRPKQGARRTRHRRRARVAKRHAAGKLFSSLHSGILAFLLAFCKSNLWPPSSPTWTIMGFEDEGAICTRSGPKPGVCSKTSFSAFTMQFWIGTYIFLTLPYGADGVKVEGIPTLLSGAAVAQARVGEPHMIFQGYIAEILLSNLLANGHINVHF